VTLSLESLVVVEPFDILEEFAFARDRSFLDRYDTNLRFSTIGKKIRSRHNPNKFLFCPRSEQTDDCQCPLGSNFGSTGSPD